MGLFGNPASFDTIVEKFTADTEGDWGLVLEICEKVGMSSEAPKECFRAIMKRLRHQNRHVVLSTITLLDTCVSNCGLQFHLEIASREFEQEFRKLLQMHHKKSIRDKLMSCLQQWAENQFKSDPQLVLIPTLYTSLQRRDVTARSSQFKILQAAVGGSLAQKMPGALFLWGAPATGKSYTLEKVLEGTGVHLIKIHCTEIFCGRRAFYETFVKQLVSWDKTVLSSSFKCDSLQSLYLNIYDYLSDINPTKSSPCPSVNVVVLVDSAELLRGEHDDILRFLVSLQDVTQGAICVVLTSVLPPQQFMPSIMDRSIIPVYFPQYTMNELIEIIMEHKIGRTSGINGSFRDFYIKMIVNMFYFVSRDLRKLLRLAATHWDTFEQMVKESPEANVTKLWKQFEPSVKKQFYEMNATARTIDMPGNQNSLAERALNIPLNAKYLLIASYLATHNPPSSDKRFFVKSKIGRAKKSRSLLNKTETNTKGFVRSFELNRLNAIFSSIQTYCDDQTVNKNRNISFMTLLTTLCQNKLVQHLGEDSFGNQKYKCLLNYETVLDISRSVHFELNNYLFRLL